MPASSVKLRRARPLDAASLAALTEQLGYPCQPDTMGARLEELANRRDHAILVAEVGKGQVVGWIHVFVRPLLIAERAAEVGGLVVDSSYRSKGIGDLLLNAAEQWAIKAGYARLRVRSNVIRERAHEFYEHRSYHRIKSQWVFEKNLGVTDQVDCS